MSENTCALYNAMYNFQFPFTVHIYREKIKYHDMEGCWGLHKVRVSAANSQEISIYFNKYLFERNKYFLAYFWEENKYILAWESFIEKVKEEVL